MSANEVFRYLRIILVLCAVVLLAGWAWHYTTSSDVPAVKKDEDTAQPKETKTKANDGPPLLLWWDPIDGTKDHNLRCGTLSCSVSVDRSRLKERDIMGVMFYGSRFAEDGLPTVRKPGHVWAALHEESPKNNQYLFQKKIIAELFNFSSTYKRQSDYPIPTMWLNHPDYVTDTVYMVPITEKNRVRKEGLAPVVFVQSDCQTPSDRGHYIEMLMKHVAVDSYGRCMNNKKLPDKLSHADTLDSMEADVFMKFLAQYKFAVAMENAVCDDYITEKFWRAIRLGTIPIVFGSPKIKDFLPSEKSAIVINDFKSVEELAARIKELDANDTEYEEYLKYKTEGISNKRLREELDSREWGHHKEHSMFEAIQCRLCEKVNELTKLAEEGKPLPVWKTKFDHFSCPEVKDFDSKGQYVLESKMYKGDWDFTDYYAEAVVHFLDKGDDADRHKIYKHARYIEDKRMRDEL